LGKGSPPAYASPMPIKAPMRKQGDIAASIPKPPTSSPGSRLGACIGTIIPRLAPGGFYSPALPARLPSVGFKPFSFAKCE